MKTDRQQLLNRLSLLKPSLKSGGLIPELSHIWFKDKEVFAYDGALGIRTKLDTGLVCGAPGGVLLGLLGTSRLTDVTIDADESGASLTVKMGRSNNKLAVLDIERGVWPFPKHDGKGDKLEVTEALIYALKHVLLVEPRHLTRAEHKGVMVYRDKKSMTLCTTDSATIANARVDYMGSPGDMILLPRAFAEQVAVKCAPGDVLRVHDDYLSADGREACYYSQVIDASEVQDVRAIIAGVVKKHPDPVPVPTGLRIALERAVLLDGRDDAVVELAIKDVDLAVSGSYKYGELSERIKLKEEHPSVTGQYTAGMLARGLPSAESMSVDKSALILHGANGALYAVAPRLVG